MVKKVFPEIGLVYVFVLYFLCNIELSREEWKLFIAVPGGVQCEKEEFHQSPKVWGCCLLSHCKPCFPSGLDW